MHQQSHSLISFCRFEVADGVQMSDLVMDLHMGKNLKGACLLIGKSIVMQRCRRGNNLWFFSARMPPPSPGSHQLPQSAPKSFFSVEVISVLHHLGELHKHRLLRLISHIQLASLEMNICASHHFLDEDQILGLQTTLGRPQLYSIAYRLPQ